MTSLEGDVVQERTKIFVANGKGEIIMLYVRKRWLGREVVQSLGTKECSLNLDEISRPINKFGDKVVRRTGFVLYKKDHFSLETFIF